MPPTILHSLLALRQEADMSQAELSDAVSVRQATISNWENGGAVRVDLDTLERLCRVLSKRLKREITLTDLRRRR